MSAKFMDFGSPVTSSDEPITFRLYDQTFRCTSVLQGYALIKFISGASDPENTAKSADAVLEFFNHALLKEDRERFHAMAESEDYIIPLDTLTKIMDWLVEQYTGRPTQQPESLPSGEEITGPTPVAVPSPPAVSASVL